MSEKAEGSSPRFYVWRDERGEVQATWWAHPELAPAGAVDCTDMTDEEFEKEVMR